MHHAIIYIFFSVLCQIIILRHAMAVQKQADVHGFDYQVEFCGIAPI